MPLETHEPSSYHSRIDTAGRLTIPANLRASHGLHSGGEVLIVSLPDGLAIRTYEQALQHAQDVFCRAAPISRILSEELISERRRDAAKDD